MEAYDSVYSHSIGIIIAAGLINSIENNQESILEQIQKNWVQTIVMMFSGLFY